MRIWGGGGKRFMTPEFNTEMTIEEFDSYYWYKEELIQICRKCHLPTYGTKSELQEYIHQFLVGISPKDIQPRRIRLSSNNQLKAADMSPKTPLLESGFSLNNEARKFFASYFGVKKFSFTKAMGIKWRTIQEEQNFSATIQDLIDCYGKKIESKEEQTYEWNHFVKDFFEDDLYKKYRNPMKVASILWSCIKNTCCPKVYSPQLFNIYQKEIKSYEK